MLYFKYYLTIPRVGLVVTVWGLWVHTHTDTSHALCFAHIATAVTRSSLTADVAPLSPASLFSLTGVFLLPHHLTLSQIAVRRQTKVQIIAFVNSCTKTNQSLNQFSPPNRLSVGIGDMPPPRH
ncbi:hypothetical protein ACSBR1_010315 [Camellia fascicularis]